MDSKQTFYGVQALRGAAACLVVAFHVAYNLQVGRGGSSLSTVYFGNGGVDLFFIISGFVIARTTEGKWREPSAWLVFLRRRLTRIFPLYWLLTSVKLAALFLVPWMFTDSAANTWNMVASYLLIPSWNEYGAALPVITAGWTLCFEMFFYYICALCLAAKLRPAITVTPVLIILAFLGYFRTPAWGAVATLLDPLLLEFLAGMWVGELVRRGWRLETTGSILTLLAAGCVGLVASSVLPVDQEYQFRVIVWGVPALAIFVSFIALESRVDFKSLRLPMLIGDASYSIYLTHVIALRPLISLLRHQPFGALGDWAACAIAICTALLLGVLVYRYVERPMTRAIAGRIRTARPQYIATIPSQSS